MVDNHYYNNNLISMDDLGTISASSTFSYGNNGLLSFSGDIAQNEKGKISAELFFKYSKKKFGILENMKLEARLEKLKKAFYKAVDNGQEFLGNKLMNEIAREARESAIYAKGIKMFIERQDLTKFKYKIKDGHISDTLLKYYTRAIPQDVLNKKKKVESVFDDFVIYHYYNEESEKKLEKKQKISQDEKNRMKDPILFGIIKETDRLYFIADWVDEYCDLSFEEIVDIIGKDEKEITINRNPIIS